MSNKVLRWTGSYFLFVLLSSITLLSAVFVSRAMGVVYDDFNGDSINQTLWDISDEGGILSQSGGLLLADGPPNSMYGNLVSTCEFQGDFEFVLDYRDFQTTATVFTGNAPQISLQVMDSTSPSNNFIYIFRGYYDNGGHVFISNGMIGGTWLNSVSLPASSQSGLLKISRAGSTITTWFDEGSGWVLLGSFPEVFTGDVNVQVGSYSGDNGTFHVSSDWITYEGEIISFPVPDIQANESDGPVTIFPGDLLTVTISLAPGSQNGEEADWWVVAKSPFGMYWLTRNSGWVRSNTPVRLYGGPLFNLPTSTILEVSTLPVGNYAFYLVIDMIMNGTLDFDQLYYDNVEVEVEQPK